MKNNTISRRRIFESYGLASPEPRFKLREEFNREVRKLPPRSSSECLRKQKICQKLSDIIFDSQGLLIMLFLFYRNNRGCINRNLSDFWFMPVRKVSISDRHKSMVKLGWIERILENWAATCGWPRCSNRF